MQLRDRALLVEYMAKKDFSQARLARYCGVSRQFVHMLTTGERTTCTLEVAKRVEEAFDLLPGTLFDPKMSPAQKRPASLQATA